MKDRSEKLINEVTEVIDLLEKNSESKARTAAETLRDRLAGKRNKARTQRVINEFKDALEDIKSATTEDELINGLARLDQFLTTKEAGFDPILKAYGHRFSLFREPLIRAWEFRNELVKTLPADKQARFKTAGDIYEQNKNATIIRKVVNRVQNRKFLHVNETVKRIPELFNMYAGFLKSRHRKILRYNLSKIQDEITKGNTLKAYIRIRQLQEFLKSLPFKRKIYYSEDAIPFYKELEALKTVLKEAENKNNITAISGYIKEHRCYLTTDQEIYNEKVKNGENIIYFYIEDGVSKLELHSNNSELTQQTISQVLTEGDKKIIDSLYNAAIQDNQKDPVQLEMQKVHLINEGIIHINQLTDIGKQFFLEETGLIQANQLSFDGKFEKAYKKMDDKCFAVILSHQLAAGDVLQKKASSGFATDAAVIFDNALLNFALTQFGFIIKAAAAKVGGDLAGAAAAAAAAYGIKQLQAQLQDPLKGIDQAEGGVMSASAKLVPRECIEIVSAAFSAEFSRTFAYQLDRAHLTEYDTKLIDKMVDLGLKSALRNLGEYRDEVLAIKWDTDPDALGTFAKIMVKAARFNPTEFGKIHAVYATQQIDENEATLKGARNFLSPYRGGKIEAEKLFTHAGYAVLNKENQLEYYDPPGSNPEKYGYIFIDYDKNLCKERYKNENVPKDIRAKCEALHEKARAKKETLLTQKADSILNRNISQAEKLKKAAAAPVGATQPQVPAPSAATVAATTPLDTPIILPPPPPLQLTSTHARLQESLNESTNPPAPSAAPQPNVALLQPQPTPPPPESAPPPVARNTAPAATITATATINTMPAISITAYRAPSEQPAPIASTDSLRHHSSSTVYTASAPSAPTSSSATLDDATLQQQATPPQSTTKPFSLEIEHLKKSEKAMVSGQVNFDAEKKETTIQVEPGGLNKVATKNMEGLIHKTDKARNERLKIAMHLAEATINSLKAGGVQPPYQVKIDCTAESEKYAPYLKSVFMKKYGIEEKNCIIRVPANHEQKVFAKQAKIEKLVEQECTKPKSRL